MNKLLAAVVILLCVVISYQWRTVSQLREALAVAKQRARELEANTSGKAQEDLSSDVSDTQVQATTEKRLEVNQALESQISELEASLAAFEPGMPGQEHPTAAYFGPGRWVNAERNGLAQVVVAGIGDNLTVQVWGHGPGELVPWPELPLCSVHTIDRSGTYRRGLAVARWSESEVVDHLLLTFERQGLRVDWLTVPAPGSNRNCAFKVTKLKRVIE